MAHDFSNHPRHLRIILGSSLSFRLVPDLSQNIGEGALNLPELPLKV